MRKRFDNYDLIPLLEIDDIAETLAEEDLIKCWFCGIWRNQKNLFVSFNNFLGVICSSCIN